MGAVTIRKELTTLQVAWNWATDAQRISTKLPSKNRLRYPKSDEKPPFKTWAEIERIIARGNLTSEQQADYWDCVYLDKEEITDLLDDASSLEPPKFLPAMLTFAAHTGARRSELLRCQVEDVDLETGHLIIREKKRVRSLRSTRSVPISPMRVFESWNLCVCVEPLRLCHSSPLPTRRTVIAPSWRVVQPRLVIGGRATIVKRRLLWQALLQI